MGEIPSLQTIMRAQQKSFTWIYEVLSKIGYGDLRSPSNPAGWAMRSHKE